MIVPMKHLTLLCVAAEQQNALEKLRDLGCVHLELLQADDSSDFRTAVGQRATVQQAISILKDAAAGKPVQPAQNKSADNELFSSARFEAALPQIPVKGAFAKAQAIVALATERSYCVNALARLADERAKYAPFGSFDTALPMQLAKEGLAVQLFKLPASADVPEVKRGMIRILSADAKNQYGVLIGVDEKPEACETIPLPALSQDDLTRLSQSAAARVEKISQSLKAVVPVEAELNAELLKQDDRVAFAQAADTMQTQGAVAWITGWMPAPREGEVRSTARLQAWGILLRDPEAGEYPPTLLEPPRLFKPVVALFKGLGIAPAYTESDVSVPFFCFFSIFFAMLVGDGGYGAIILALTLWAWHKAGRKAPKSWFILLTCFAVATIIWGALTNTWFGASPRCLSNPVSHWFDSAPGMPDEKYHHIMLFCFTIGVVHLGIARIWNAILLFPDTKFLAEVGWAGVLGFMYVITCSIVGIFPGVPQFMYYVLGVSIFFLFFFSLKKSELKTNGIALGMLPLNIVSTLGDIISYVRLFAVGLASVKVAQNFNGMAVGLNIPVWLKIIPMALILLLGHGLNFAMAGLSILVHAVRLNTLEFSNHKGISWSGFAFKPFKRESADAARS
jgi:V/A-type H+-transporting ATPase subunit I